MIIEFQAPAGAIQEWVIDDLKKKIIEFHHMDKDITYAQVFFRRQPIAFDGDYVCEIELTTYGGSIMVQRNGVNYVQAAKEVIKELTEKVQKRVLQHRELPDEVLSTVAV